MIRLLLAAIATVVGLSLATYAFFWYETVNGEHRLWLDERSKGRTRLWLMMGIASSLASMVCVVAFFPLGFWRRRGAASPDPGRTSPPVLLVHGLYHNASAWILFRKWLERAGFHNHHVFDYFSLGTDFWTLAKRLDEKVAELADRFPGQGIVLIGHSLGGLLCRACVECAPSRHQVAAVLTLGCPHQGSKLAAFAVGRLGRSLLYRGELFAQLEERAVSTKVPRHAWYSPVDNMVLPNEALRNGLSDWQMHECAPVSHVAMLFHKPTAQAVIITLKASIGASASR